MLEIRCVKFGNGRESKSAATMCIHVTLKSCGFFWMASVEDYVWV